MSGKSAAAAAAATAVTQQLAAAAAPISDESLMKTRLLIDGDGTGDDRRLAQILKGVIKFCSMSGENEEEVKRAHDKLVAQLESAEWVDAKNKLVQTMNQVELNNYEALYNDIDEGIQQAKEDIQTAKVELEEARKVRTNKMEYDALAKAICVNPDRDTTSQRLSEIKAELDQLGETEESLDEKLELRKKHFYVLVHSIQQLQDLLDKDKEEDDAVPSSSGDGEDNKNLDTSNVSSAQDTHEENGVMDVN